jgi:hypothetical protein
MRQNSGKSQAISECGYDKLAIRHSKQIAILAPPVFQQPARTSSDAVPCLIYATKPINIRFCQFDCHRRYLMIKF